MLFWREVILVVLCFYTEIHYAIYRNKLLAIFNFIELKILAKISTYTIEDFIRAYYVRNEILTI